MRTLSLMLLAVALLLLPVPRVAAWNELGHMTIAKLAWERLDTRQREATYEILKALPYFERFMGERPRPEGVSPQEWAFLNASTWPDWLRDFTTTGKRPTPDIARYHVGPRHYINLKLAAADLESPDTPAAPVDPKIAAEENIVNGIQGSTAQLQERDTPAAQKAIALCWLLHLVGDIHQPLHCGSFFSKDYPLPGGDLGGNVRWIKAADGPKNFHAYWDDLLGSSEDHGRPPFAASSSVKIWDRIGEQYGLLRGEQYQRERYGARLQVSDPMEWAREGSGLARRHVYVFRGAAIPGYPIPRYYQMAGPEKQAEAAKAPPLPPGYAEAALDLARRQVALAGYRLADRLNLSFAARRANP